MRKTLKLSLLAAAALAYAAGAQAQKAEVIHWWTSGGEAAAIKAKVAQTAQLTVAQRKQLSSFGGVMKLEHGAHLHH